MAKIEPTTSELLVAEKVAHWWFNGAPDQHDQDALERRIADEIAKARVKADRDLVKLRKELGLTAS